MLRQRSKHRRCRTKWSAFTSGSGWIPPKCVMCGEPVLPTQDSSNWYAPTDPLANEYGRVSRHAQDSSDDVPCFRFDRKWGRRQPDKEKT